MTPTVAVIAPGNMGAAVGARLVEQGVTVLTTLAGRSSASAQRAAAAGITAVDDAEIGTADFVLSIVPPAEALPLAERLAPVLSGANRKPLYVDCNAINPETVTRVADVLAEMGTPFADAGIIGGPPRAGYAGPSFYVSGAEARRVAALSQYGLVIHVMDAPVGAASALKMSYGGLTKGLIALGSALALAASRAGIAEALQAELAASQPALVAWFARMLPGMPGKAYRWVAEMEEISDFVGARAESDMFAGAAGFYQRLAEDFEDRREEIARLEAFFAKVQ
jgi:3-hydroxyisobutyrate dehydrogenase-like beta-hydroxyacid dehydrogenase